MQEQLWPIQGCCLVVSMLVPVRRSVAPAADQHLPSHFPLHGHVESTSPFTVVRKLPFCNTPVRSYRLVQELKNWLPCQRLLTSLLLS